ncbi:MAG: electron transfer flavoprotein subunit alpha/FixB family protein, partial [Steroidobacteraceae bacterium]|nr:electron transfer flavoprotein subunit alpha/FixB family protein [Steroidobacteraceae bacterium]
MSQVLIVAEHDGNRLHPTVAKCVKCASGIPGAAIHIAVFAAGGAEVAAQAAKLDGVAKVLLVDHPANEHALAACLAPQVVAIAGPYTHVFGPSTTFGKDLMPRVAALLDVGQVSDVMAVVDATTFRRPIYAGNAIVTVEVPAGSKVVATVRAASFDSVGASGGAAVERITTTA